MVEKCRFADDCGAKDSNSFTMSPLFAFRMSRQRETAWARAEARVTHHSS